MVKTAARRARERAAAAAGVPFVPQRGASSKKKKSVTVKVTGSGAYKMAPRSSLVQIGRESAGAALGRAVGSSFGGPALGHLGAYLGGQAHRMFKSITGYGSYAIANGSLNQRHGHRASQPGTVVLSSIVPEFGEGREGVNDVVYSECLGNVYSSTGVSWQTYNVNPGLPKSFPYLSKIAACYEEWAPVGMIYQFRSLCSASATSLSLGKVCLSSQYNVRKDPALSSLDMENHAYAVSGKPSDSFLHMVECSPRQSNRKLFMVRTGEVAASDDLRDYDPCFVQILTEGQPADGQLIGELWVSYKIAFFKPCPSNRVQPVGGVWQQMSGLGISTTGYVTNLTASLRADYPTDHLDIEFGMQQMASGTILPGISIAPTFSGPLTLILTVNNWEQSYTGQLLAYTRDSAAAPRFYQESNFFSDGSSPPVKTMRFTASGWGIIYMMVYILPGTNRLRIGYTFGTLPAAVTNAQFTLMVQPGIADSSHSPTLTGRYACGSPAGSSGEECVREITAGAETIPVPPGGHALSTVNQAVFDANNYAVGSNVWSYTGPIPPARPEDSSSSSSGALHGESRRESDVEVDLQIAAIKSLSPKSLVRHFGGLRG